jgi:hypothetical protein
MYEVSTQAIWSWAADRLPWIWGSATLAIVLSTPCMIVASMIETVIAPRWPSGLRASPLTEAPGLATSLPAGDRRPSGYDTQNRAAAFAIRERGRYAAGTKKFDGLNAVAQRPVFGEAARADQRQGEAPTDSQVAGSQHNCVAGSREFDGSATLLVEDRKSFHSFT